MKFCIFSSVIHCQFFFRSFQMNIFILHELAQKAAQQHCDKHVVKMILETCQLLYTAWWRGRKNPPWSECPFPPYKAILHNHPSAIWVRAHKNHYDYAVALGLELCFEFTRRYGGEHKCYHHLLRLQTMGYPELLEEEDYLPDLRKRATVNCPKNCEYFDCAINDHVFDICAVYDPKSQKLDAIKTYQNYYISKTHFSLVWNKGHDLPPDWYTAGLESDQVRGGIRNKNANLLGIKPEALKENQRPEVKFKDRRKKIKNFKKIIDRFPGTEPKAEKVKDSPKKVKLEVESSKKTDKSSKNSTPAKPRIFKKSKKMLKIETDESSSDEDVVSPPKRFKVEVKQEVICLDTTAESEVGQVNHSEHIKSLKQSPEKIQSVARNLENSFQGRITRSKTRMQQMAASKLPKNELRNLSQQMLNISIDPELEN